MFKHLTRIATNQVKSHNAIKSAVFRRTQVAFNQQRFFASFEQAQLKSNFNFETSNLGEAAQKQSRASAIEDYEVDDLDIVRVKKFLLTPKEFQKKHPSEFGVQEQRQDLEYINKLKINQFLLFNFPKSVTLEQVKEFCSIKGVEVINAWLSKALDGERNAFAKVEVGHPQQIKLLKDKFRNFWVEDKKVKLMVNEELSYETYEHRTIIVQNIPIHYRPDDVVQMFSTYGSVVSVEMPTKNQAIHQAIMNKTDYYATEMKEKHVQDFKRAQKIVASSIQENGEYRAFLVKYLGEEQADQILVQYLPRPDEEATQLDVLQGQRHYSITNMLSNLQTENSEVQQVKRALLNLKAYTEDDASVPSLSSAVDHQRLSENWQQKLNENQEVVRRAINYVKQNREAIDEKTLSQLNQAINAENTEDHNDPIERLQQLSKKELTFAYDVLLNCLNDREELIEDRIKKQIDHLGIEERILFEKKDWSKELEGMKTFEDPFSDAVKVEAILSVNEQMYNIHQSKHMSPQETLYRLVKQSYDPTVPVNFSEKQIHNAENEQLDDFRVPKYAVDQTMPPSLNRAMFKGYKYTDRNLERIQEHIEEVRNSFDLPFDELYHKEKKLVDQVIKAELALKAKEETLPNPMGEDRMFNKDQIDKNILSKDFDTEHQFVKDQRKQKEKLFQQQMDTGNAEFEFMVNEGAEGQTSLISEKDKQLIEKLKNEATEVNLGYAFLTFSHSDEAKLAIILGNGMEADGVDVEVTRKNKNVDHKHFDSRYMMNQKRNDSRAVKEIEALRESRKELREFEDNIDKDLPSMKKLKLFNKLARDVIEDRPYLSRASESSKRTPAEEEELNQKIRVMQKQNPNNDYSQLFDTERAEVARKVAHKKAFASYKAYQFLKHGLDIQKGRASLVPSEQQPIKPNVFKAIDPYNFPPIEETVAMFLTKDRFPTVMDAGETIERPGRRFGYTEQDFLEAYNGKDGARNATVGFEQNQVFGFNDSLKKRFPVDQYLKSPVLEQKRKEFQLKTLMPSHDTEFHNKDFGRYIDTIDLVGSIQRNEHQTDMPHPTDPHRTLLTDANKRLESYMKRKEEKTGEPIFNTREVTMIKRALKEEYGLNKPKVPAYVKPVHASDAEKGEIVADTKVEEKFEPFYENETETNTASTAQNDDTTTTAQNDDTSTTITTTADNDTPEVIVQKPQSQQQQNKQYQQRGADSGRDNSKRQDFQRVKKQVISKEPLKYGQKLVPNEVEFVQKASLEQQELNSDIIYDYKFRKEQLGQDFDEEFESLNMQKYQRLAKTSNMKTEDLLEQLKQWGDISDLNAHGGEMTKKQKYGTLKDELDVKGRDRKPKNLKDFVEEQDLSEREDEDIYSHYMEQMQKAKLEEAKQVKAKLTPQEQLAQDQVNKLKDIFPEMPRFEGFFQSQSQGKHPFEDEKFSEFRNDESKEQREAEEEYDEELHQRELQGRLIGETLTPRQFGVLYKAKIEEGQQLQFIKDEERNEYINNRDMVRFIEELKEGMRRRMVMSGECTEEQSYQKAQEQMIEINKHCENQNYNEMMKREYKDLQNLIKNTQNPKSVYEKEYYFDEGLGESVNQHVLQIKENFPALEIEVRRDRDGYAIIKTILKPKYKYNLEDIEKFDPKGQEVKVKELLDDVFKTVLGSQDGNGIQKLDKHQLEQTLLMTMQKGQGQKDVDYDLDDKTKDAVAQLWKERVNGKFATDREGFSKAFLELTENATVDKNKKMAFAQSLFSTENDFDTKQAVDDLVKERHQMTYELAEQLSLRIKEHLYMKQRKETDFVKAKQSEVAMFSSQLNTQNNTIKIMEQDLENNKEGSKDFDKEAYQEIKKEIKRRREAKERLLRQGFPELKSYISI